ncbi:MAG: peptidoglycan-binding domain-containing protein [Actinomycetota bacterium]
MANTATKRQWWAEYRCKSGVRMSFFGRSPVFAANADVADAWRALEQTLLASGYVPTKGAFIGSHRSCTSGIGSGPCEEDGTNCSMHNYEIALDIEYGGDDEGVMYNKHLREDKPDPAWVFRNCKFTEANYDAVMSVKNLQGERMFRWLGLINADTMHWELDVPPDKCKVDWSTVPGGNGGTEEQMLQEGDIGKAVKHYQEQLLAWDSAALPKHGADSDYGSEMKEWVENFQTAHDLAATGTVDGVTASMMDNYASGG